MGQYESLTKYAKRMGVTYQTAWRWAKSGKIETVRVGNSVFVPLAEPITDSTAPTDRVALYARVSSSQNKDNLETQLERLQSYAAAKGYTVIRSVTEVGSGLNDNRPKLAALFTEDNWNVLVVEHKDRLTRFGFRYLEWLAAAQHRRIEVINETDDTTDRRTEKIIAELNSRD